MDMEVKNVMSPGTVRMSCLACAVALVLCTLTTESVHAEGSSALQSPPLSPSITAIVNSRADLTAHIKVEVERDSLPADG